MIIRAANITDAVSIARLFIQPMGVLAGKFSGSNNPKDAVSLFTRFIAQQANQYSFENILVYEDDMGVRGFICGYDGALLHTLREPFITYISIYNGFAGLLEDETQPGEFYLDTVSVHPDLQGRGVGSQLIRALFKRSLSKGFNRVGLLVEPTNASAIRLYKKLGFELLQQRKFMGGDYLHLQRLL